MDFIAAAVSGAAFGAAMTAAGFHDPSLIIDQMNLKRWHMLQAFMAATASSAIICCIVQEVYRVEVAPRHASPLGLLAGNVIGGALLGVGIALSGSCPGALFAQLAVGRKAACFTLAGAVMGAVLWTSHLSRLVPDKGPDWPGPEHVRLSKTKAMLLLQTVCLAVVAMTPTPRGRINGAVGGLVIGFAQLVSLITRRSMLGASGSYQEVAVLLRQLAGGDGGKHLPHGHGRNFAFASGAVVGAWLLLHAVPSLAVDTTLEPAAPLAFIGGCLMLLGATMAGGCTSGHGISGIALLSPSSVVTMASVFAAGASVAPLAY
ncbi:hypothetical protein L249_4421 [Ophiocordyceps polyrhachis-furcata BCC 54312]|uniref:Uncharacterized protein n=1 Tax=Ophiocordyceps polyrhachis-furcata BCC 54312 TaxID=1330021 RepID=A0A367L7Z8_9HYPO|nr:hypothetical protein L249_4421 [Ophiocordyceps polyrhachis-furcata BCC 54312]